VAVAALQFFERFAVALCLGSLLLVPVLIAVHAPLERSPLDALPRAVLTPLSRFWLVLLRVYLVAAVALLVVRVVQIALHQ
jgi:hypothetical protein